MDLWAVIYFLHILYLNIRSSNISLLKLLRENSSSKRLLWLTVMKLEIRKHVIFQWLLTHIVGSIHFPQSSLQYFARQASYFVASVNNIGNHLHTVYILCMHTRFYMCTNVLQYNQMSEGSDVYVCLWMMFLYNIELVGRWLGSNTE